MLHLPHGVVYLALALIYCAGMLGLDKPTLYGLAAFAYVMLALAR